MTDIRPELDVLERAIWQTLCYFDIFSYPLPAKEVWAFLGVQTSPDAVQPTLNAMVRAGRIVQEGEFYMIAPNSAWVPERLACNRRAVDIMPMAHRMAARIGKFPFIRGVFISGSLSKMCLQPDGDIDFFIITQPQRLWLARTLLALYKKIFLFNSHKYFCINYFVDTEHTAIEERNIYTATETLTMIPVFGRDACERFFAENQWASAYLPNLQPENNLPPQPLLTPRTKRFLEYSLSGALGEWLDRQCMAVTVAFWQRKFKKMSKEDFQVALKSNRHTSKHHPLFFQKMVLEALKNRL